MPLHLHCLYPVCLFIENIAYFKSKKGVRGAPVRGEQQVGQEGPGHGAEGRQEDEKGWLELESGPGFLLIRFQ